MRKVAFLGLWLLVALSACDTNRLVDVFEPVEGGAWHYEDVKSIRLSVTDTVSLHNFYLNLRHEGTYEWRNLYLRLKFTSPNADTAVQLLSVPLADASGKWLGSGLGDMYEVQHLFKEGIQFKQVGEYTIELEQHMRVNPLPGVLDVGLRIEKAS